MFYDQLSEFVETSTDRSLIISTEKYEMFITETKQSQLLKKNSQPLSSKQYCCLKRCDVLKIGDTEKLVEAGIKAQIQKSVNSPKQMNSDILETSVAVSCCLPENYQKWL